MAIPQNGQGTQDNLIQLIAFWMFANYHKIQDARTSRGGWEIWTQVELKFRLDPPAGPNPPYQVLREQNNIWQNTVANPNGAGQIIDSGYSPRIPNSNTTSAWSSSAVVRKRRSTSGIDSAMIV